MSRWSPRLLVVASVILVLTCLTIFGATDGWPAWVKGSSQAVAAILAAYLGAQFKSAEDRQAVSDQGKAALSNLVALAAAQRGLISVVQQFSQQLDDLPPASLASYRGHVATFLTGVEAQTASMLVQARVASEAWRPHVDDYEHYLGTISGESPDD